MRSVFPLLLAVACAVPVTDKDDASDAPFASVEAAGKNDSATRPVDKGLLKVGRYGHGAFSATDGWLAYNIYLTAGEVDVAAHGLEADGATPQDTILYLYGPQRANGTFPSRAIAFNDDEEPGASVASYLHAAIPVDGTYRVVVSTYDNWRAYPRNVARGDWHVIVKCPRTAGALACGPAALAEGGVCWADMDCMDGLRCEGEVTCPPDAVCIWSREGQCVVDKTWMTYAPKQCGQNAWQEHPAAGSSHLDGELADVQGYFASQNIQLLHLGFLRSAEPRFQCLACNCARGDTLLVEVGPFDAARLEREYGFTRVTDDALAGLGPKQCGANPWDENADREMELESVESWAAASGAKLGVRGFVFRGEAMAVCAACSCPRGDLLVVTGVDDDSSGSLRILGFENLYRP